MCLPLKMNQVLTTYNMKVVKTRRTADSLSGNVLPMVTMSDDPTSSAMPFEQFTDNDGADYDKRWIEIGFTIYN